MKANNYVLHFTFYVLRFTFYVLLFLAIIWLVTPATAQDPVTDDEVNEVAKGVYCPVCESTPLDVCPTQACADWRELIRSKLGEGQSKEEIYDYFARQYGDGVLGAPPRRGFNLVLWFFPVIALFAGGFFFSRLLRNLRANSRSTEEPEQEISSGTPLATDSEYVAQVEEALQEK